MSFCLLRQDTGRWVSHLIASQWLGRLGCDVFLFLCIGDMLIRGLFLLVGDSGAHSLSHPDQARAGCSASIHANAAGAASIGWLQRDRVAVCLK